MVRFLGNKPLTKKTKNNMNHETPPKKMKFFVRVCFGGNNGDVPVPKKRFEHPGFLGVFQSSLPASICNTAKPGFFGGGCCVCVLDMIFVGFVSSNQGIWA